MPTIATTRVRPEWIDKTLAELGTATRLAEKLGVDKSTCSRWISGRTEASPRFIGSVLLAFPISFDDAFVVTEEAAIRERVRYRTRPANTAA